MAPLSQAPSLVSQGEPMEFRTLKRRDGTGLKKGSIGTLSAGSYYVLDSDWVRDLVQDLKLVNPPALAVAVVDRNLRPLGLLVASRIQSRAFSKEVYDARPVSDFLEQARVLPRDRDLLAVAGTLDAELKDSRNRYFLLDQPDGSYAGIFTTRDLQTHLLGTFGQDLLLADRLRESLVPPGTGGAFGTLEYRAEPGVPGESGGWSGFRSLGLGQGLAAFAEVAGRGAPAALAYQTLETALAVADLSQGVGPFLTALNDLVHRTRGLSAGFSCFFALWDDRTGVLRTFNLGHRTALLTGPEGPVPLPPDNPCLGLEPALVPLAKDLTLGDGDVLVLRTSGASPATVFLRLKDGA